jgi:hypothetical protein
MVEEAVEGVRNAEDGTCGPGTPAHVDTTG